MIWGSKQAKERKKKKGREGERKERKKEKRKKKEKEVKTGGREGALSHLGSRNCAREWNPLICHQKHQLSAHGSLLLNRVAAVGHTC